MSQPHTSSEPPQIQPPDGVRRPRFALMGEFSAGKSTLANLMIGTTELPAQVVATQLPPVWISHGDGPTTKVNLDGTREQCDLNCGADLSLRETAFIEFHCKADILTVCDLIDLPGLSDPNMSVDVWERIIPFADAVIWCSPATQAWRQSEAAVWECLPSQVKRHSILLLTRADMIFDAADRQKVLDRARRETKGLFASVQMISLTQAAEAETDDGLWVPSGAEEFVTSFMAVLNQIAVDLGITHDTGKDETEQVASAEAAQNHVGEGNACGIRKNSDPNHSSQPIDAPETTYTPKFS